MISALVAVEHVDNTLNRNELLMLLRLLLVAGHETTTDLIGNGLFALLRHPQQLQSLREQPSLMASAIEELLRYDSPVQVDARAAAGTSVGTFSYLAVSIILVCCAQFATITAETAAETVTHEPVEGLTEPAA